MLLFQILEHMAVLRRHMPRIADAALRLQLREYRRSAQVLILICRLREGADRHKFFGVFLNLEQVDLGA